MEGETCTNIQKLGSVNVYPWLPCFYVCVSVSTMCLLRVFVCVSMTDMCLCIRVYCVSLRLVPVQPCHKIRAASRSAFAASCSASRHPTPATRHPDPRLAPP
jgi:hypothetical protein